MNQGRIIVITGAPGTGKTTTASVVAKESDLEKSVHMHTDDFYHYLSKGAIMLFPLETSMPTQFIHIPPIQRICNRNPSFLAADSIYWVTRTPRHPVAQPA